MPLILFTIIHQDIYAFFEIFLKCRQKQDPRQLLRSRGSVSSLGRSLNTAWIIVSSLITSARECSQGSQCRATPARRGGGDIKVIIEIIL